METSSTTSNALRDEPRWRARWHVVATHADSLWLAAITLVGACCRLCFLEAPIRYDEAFTFLTFVKAGFAQLFEYPYPNNHILHTLFVRATTDLFGREVAIIRLPAFVFGVMAIPLTFRLARRLGSRACGYLAATGVAALPYLVLYSSIARGYSLVVALSLGIALLGLELAEKLSGRRCALLALLSALGLLTMPSMAFVLAGTGLWIAALLLLARRSKLSIAAFLGAYTALTAALTLVFYTPTLIISGASAVVRNRFVAPLPWHAFADKLGPHLLGTASDFARDLPLLATSACGALASLGLVGALVTRNWLAFVLLPSLVFGAASLLVLKQSIPYARTWVYLLPFVLVLADLGLGFVLQRMAGCCRALIALSLLACGSFACKQIVTHDLLARYPDVGAFPEASALVHRLKPLLHRGEPVHVRSPGNYPVRFYLWYYGVPEQERKPRRPRQEFIVVRKGVDPIPDGDPKLAFEHGQLEVYRRAQRRKPGKALSKALEQRTH
jgi:hypothetical protein